MCDDRALVPVFINPDGDGLSPQPPLSFFLRLIIPHRLMKMQRSTSFPSNDDVTAITHSSDRRVPPEDPPFSHKFLEKDPETARARSLYFKIIGPTLVLVFTYVIWGVLPIYWGSLFTLYDHTHNLHGWVVVSIRSVYVSLSGLKSDARGCL